MKSNRYIFIQPLITFLFTILLCHGLNAQQYLGSPLIGAGIAVGNSVQVNDPLCSHPSVCNEFTNCSYDSYIELGVDPLSDPNTTFIPGIYSLEIDIEVDYTEASGTVKLDELHTLNIEFNVAGGQFKSIDRHLIFDGGFIVDAEVTSINFNDPNGTAAAIPIPDDVYLNVGINTDRFKVLDQNAIATITYPSSADQFINLSWLTINNAESYDLEWTWIDTDLIDPTKALVDFKNNSTRINTTANSYVFANIYKKGAIVARVRSVGRSLCDQVEYGDWNLVNVTDYNLIPTSDQLILLENHEDINWTVARLYAEEGKSKDVRSFFDGRNNQRQTVSRIESDDLVVVNETYYDHVGRAAVHSIPTPIFLGSNYESDLKFYPNINKSGNQPYGKVHFENETSACEIDALPMDSNEGNGLYYSPLNPILDNQQAYLPDAKGYPYSHTLFTQDGSNRTLMQSGVGEKFKNGSGHETKYYYGVPEQKEIDRLFGSDAGYAQYYEKRMTVDPNGQASVSYKDNKDRTVATALTGKSPDQLTELPSYANATYLIQSELADLNVLQNKGEQSAQLNINKQIVVSDIAVPYIFDYAFTPQDFTDDCAPAVCFDCAYELKLEVYDDCNQKIMESTGAQNLIHPSNLDASCENEASHSFQLTQDLDLGSYSINKVLSLDKNFMDQYEELYVEAYDCVQTTVEIFEILINDIDLSGCIDAACLTLCTSEIVGSSYGNDLESYVADLSQCLDEKIESEECSRTELENVNSCDLFRLQLEKDMSPFGQYGTVTNDLGEVVVNDLPIISFYSLINIYGANYSSISYGSITVDVNGQDLSPAELSLVDYVAYFDDSWLEYILPYHPEYPYLDYCENHNAASIDFDDNILSFTYDEAYAAGYLNPHNMTITGYDIGGIGSPLSPIVGAVVANSTSSDIQDLQANMLLFPVLDGDLEGYSIWDMAYIVALSNTLDINAIIDNNPPAPGQWANIYGANLCRTDRFWEAFRVLYKYLKDKNSAAIIDSFIQNYNTSNPSHPFPNFLITIEDECFGIGIECADCADCPSNCNTVCGSCDEETCETCQDCGPWSKTYARYMGIESLVDEDCKPLEGALAGDIPFNEIVEGADDENNHPSIETEANAAVDIGIDTHCQTTCESYRATWEQELKTCETMRMLSAIDFAALLDEMETICQEGCDESNILGASSNANGTNNFQMAISGALQNASLGTMDEYCNDLLISAPRPYGSDLFAGSQPVIDECVCDNYNNLYDKYAIGEVNPNLQDFYSFLVENYQVEYEQDVLTDIDCVCKQISSPHLLEPAYSSFEIPKEFACNPCVTCDQILELFDVFENSTYNYFGTIQVFDFDDELFQSIITNWYNSELEFNLTFEEYSDFLIYCGLNFPIIPLNGEGISAKGFKERNINIVQFEEFEEPEGSINEKLDNNLKNRSSLNVDLTLEALSEKAEPGSTIEYRFTITNNSLNPLTMDFWDALPPGWTFSNYPSNLHGGTLAGTSPNIMQVDGFDIDPYQTIIWDVEVTINSQIYLPADYCHQATVETPTLLEYSDDPNNPGIDDPTCISVCPHDPCGGPEETAEDLLDFLNEVLDLMNNSGSPCNYPYTFPINSLNSFASGSSLNLWPYLNENEIQVEVLDPALNGGELTFNFVRVCSVSELLCSLEFTDLEDFCELEEVLNIASSGFIDDNYNNLLELDVLLDDGTTTSIFISSSCYDLIPCDKEILCNRSIFIEATIEDNCLDYVLDLLSLQAKTEHETIINEARERFRVEYSLQCMDTNDELNMSFNNREHHYTLYYYDQSANLVRTVAPKGVNPLPSTYMAAVTNHRNYPTSFPAIYPTNSFVTNYKQNNYNQIIKSDNPDAEEEVFFYDNLGRLVVSQDGRQRQSDVYSMPRYSYTVFDKQGRLVEAGEVEQATSNPMTAQIAADETMLINWLNSGSNRYNVSLNIFDENLTDGAQGIDVDSHFDEPRVYLRKRISSSLYFKEYSSGDLDFDHAMHYDYDVHGNVITFINEFSSLESIDQHLKKVEYEYDLVSGNVNLIKFQDGLPDAFYQQYVYDKDNRLTKVLTSHNGHIWDEDARYNYYDHGMMARSELGENNVQACDFAYTLQGWIKGINSNTLVEDRDIGKDGLPASPHENVAADAFGYSLGYFENDYEQIDGSIGSNNLFLATEPTGLDDLFNGNIRSSIYTIKRPDGSIMENTPSVYEYDQLQRLKKMQRKSAVDEANNSWTNSNDIIKYLTEPHYDANGNITNLFRYGTNLYIDGLNYTYPVGTNQLEKVTDQVPSGSFPNDIDDMGTDIFVYDDAGNLKSDFNESIANILWNRHGKIQNIIRTPGTDLAEKPNVFYEYDAAGNRIIKRIQKGYNAEDWSYKYYSRDAEGNILKIYTGENSSQPNSFEIAEIFENESHIFGAGRLGIKMSEIPNEDLGTFIPNSDKVQKYSGSRNYELSNHLGNVMSVVSDNKLLTYTNNAVSKYEPEIVSATDYYPFGWEMIGRTESNEGYRFGFNGKEKDDEVKGSGIHYDYGFRIYDTRLGKFLSLDPLRKDYPWYTPYQFAGNMPIQAIDLDGLEPYVEDGILVGYNVQKGQGPTQIAKDLNDPNIQKKYGFSLAQKIEWTDIVYYNVDKFDNVVSGKGAAYDKYNKDYYSGNIIPNQRLNILSEPASTPDGYNDDAAWTLGLLFNIGKEVAYSKTFGTWTDKQGKIRSQSWGGNGTTGGKNKFARRNSRVLNIANYAIGAYNFYEIESSFSDGGITRGQANGLQLNNTVMTFTPPYISIPMGIGTKYGEKNADEIEDKAVWFTKYIMFPILGADEDGNKKSEENK